MKKRIGVSQIGELTRIFVQYTLAYVINVYVLCFL